MKKRRLITSALPYVNNVPHLGNLIQVLSADVFARFCRLAGYETLYVCGTDEYGTATETRALEEGISPKELCDRYFAIHSDIYNWFNIAFDKWGRTSTPQHTEITQQIFTKLDQNGFINRRTIEQLYCEVCERFLADRYVRGICPHCEYPEARGDQCENCGKLLDPTDLLEPRCGTCGSTPVARSTEHLYLDLPAILPKLQEWMADAAERGFWAKNAIQMTRSWIRDGLHERGITRDLKWGIPVPKAGFEDKVFYVWFDAPIGYVSITATHTDSWESWWRNPENVELFQFIGKDNIPFHTVVFPSSQLGTGESWTMLHHMSSSEYLNYEGGKFSKSKGIGVFGSDAMETGIPPDVWRFYVYYNRPEKSDALFTWRDFQEKVNSELIGNLANLVNRTLTFVDRFYDGVVPEAEIDVGLWSEIRRREESITEHLERAELKEALHEVFALSSVGNKRFQDGEPWRTRTSDPKSAAKLIRNLTLLVRDLALLISPYLPGTAARVLSFLGQGIGIWSDLGKASGVERVAKPEILFAKLEDDLIDDLRTRFAGSQKERHDVEALNRFAAGVELRAARIVSVTRHPKADKLYVENIDVGDQRERQIVSGLVGHYEESELVGRMIVLVTNLKPAKLRGEVSQGMLLAADSGDSLEVLFVDNARPGDLIEATGHERGDPLRHLDEISIDEFFLTPITVSDHQVEVEATPLVCRGETLKTSRVKAGSVG